MASGGLYGGHLFIPIIARYFIVYRPDAIIGMFYMLPDMVSDIMGMFLFIIVYSNHAVWGVLLSINLADTF